jgi:hypothetical protein
MGDRIERSNSFKVALVTAASLVAIILVTTQFLHIGIEFPVMGPVILFLAYLVSSGWTPLSEWDPALYWSLAIIITTLVEIVFAFLLR